MKAVQNPYLINYFQYVNERDFRIEGAFYCMFGRDGLFFFRIGISSMGQNLTRKPYRHLQSARHISDVFASISGFWKKCCTFTQKQVALMGGGVHTLSAF